MNCKTVHNKLIFFLENELPVSEMKQVEQHLESCSECALFLKEMQLSFSILEDEKVHEQNPFFYTRVKARLENMDAKQVVGQAIFARVLQPLAFSVILLLGVYGGIKLGQPHKTELASSTLSEQQMVPYLNGMDAEPIEAFLME